MERKGPTTLQTHFFAFISSLGFLILIIPFLARAPGEKIFSVEEGNEGRASVRLIFVGDVMLSRHIGTIMERQNDWTFPYQLVKERLLTADLVFGNLENPVSTRGKNQGSIYSFRANPESLLALREAGFSVVSIANNHMFDWGSEAFLDTISHLSDIGIAHAGGGESLSDAREPAVLERNGTRFAFLAYSQFAGYRPQADMPAMAPLDPLIMREDVMRARAIAQVVIVSVHWGNEYETFATLEQKEIARALVDAGATLVIGHHPHVIQEIEEYHNGLIAYSLGNFIFDQNFSEDTRKGLLLEVSMRGEVIESFSPSTVRFTDLFQPFVVSEVY